ncbi:MAG: hypothetical protein JW844_05220 [Candidatus Omnitrophica bacterium]|nr:hypothetical protein [Candidatus Omnitrophota bacterium]
MGPIGRKIPNFFKDLISPKDDSYPVANIIVLIIILIFLIIVLNEFFKDLFLAMQ